MVIWLYRFLFLPLLLVLAPYYLLRMWRRGGYRRDFYNRFGFMGPVPAKSQGVKRIWIQAVSVGETLAIAPILRKLTTDPTVEIYLTTTTSTGYALARANYENDTIGVGYFPLDFWFFSARAWREIKPDLVILTEGERWPEHIHQAAKRGMPVLCINARMSDRSYARMRLIRGLVPSLMGGVSKLLAVSAEDAERLQDLGFAPDRIDITGNIKLDVVITELSAQERHTWRTELGLGADDLILLGSSTWPGEEAALVGAWQKIRESGISCRLLLVPRHMERREELVELLENSDASFHVRSTGIAQREVDVALADTTGELQRLTQLADVVFVGKSLGDHTEGQTPVEAAALGRAIVFGPGMANFRAIAADLLGAEAALQVSDPVELSKVCRELLEVPERRLALGEAAHRWHRANQGAVDRTVRAIRLLLGA